VTVVVVRANEQYWSVQVIPVESEPCCSDSSSLFATPLLKMMKMLKMKMLKMKKRKKEEEAVLEKQQCIAGWQ